MGDKPKDNLICSVTNFLEYLRDGHNETNSLRADQRPAKYHLTCPHSSHVETKATPQKSLTYP